MAPVPGFANLLPLFPVLLAHLAGVVVAIILLVHPERRRAPAVFALLGFALLSVLDLVNLAQGPLIRLLTHRTATGARLAVTGVGCCYSIFDVAAVACLIIAMWQAMSRAGAREAGPRGTSAPHEGE